MAFALLIIGITLIVSAVRNTVTDLITLIKGDFSGQGNFLYWIAALLLVGAVGYIPRLKPISDGLLVAIVLAVLLSRGNPKGSYNFFGKFTQALGVNASAGGGTGGVSINLGGTPPTSVSA